ncbi:HAMP domain-containing sensor histidine kinase [Gaopeijia maritima]|uniref:HAMP domain-containing sensor histidine kinase n=1 Tax=Gaopeijia maritima TaxID=3119007 RepID=UPI0032479061
MHQSPPPRPRPLPALIRPLLRIPLGWKLLAPWLVGVAAVVGWAAVYGAGAGSLPVLAGILGLFAGLGIAAVRWALRPLHSLADTARRVTSGDDAARVPRSPLADPRTAQLIETFNEMLDALDTERRRRWDDATWMVEAEERQRERVAAELYGGPAQTLAGVLVQLRMWERGVESEPGGEAPIAALAPEVRGALEEVRTLARRLRPPELGELGTLAAIQALARRTEASSGVRVDVSGAIPDPRLPPAARSALYRIVEECLGDLPVGHGTAPGRIAFTPANHHLDMELHLPPVDRSVRSGAPAPDASPRWRVVAHRAELVGGRLTASSTPGEGLRIHLELPLLGPGAGPSGREPWTPPALSGVPLSGV